MKCRPGYFVWLACTLQAFLGTCADVSFLPLYSGNNSDVVHSNFFGISIELSPIHTLIGENSSSISPQLKAYLSTIQTRARNPLRIRIGGNSMDDSVFNLSQTEMIIYTGQEVSAHDQPVSYGSVFFDVLAELANSIGGVEYLLGLALLLREENDTPLVVSTAQQKLGGHLDVFLLGNEPDLYGPHNRRESNYSVQDYFTEFGNVSQQLNSSSQYGDLLQTTQIGGPTICCNWELADILNQGYLREFGSELKYINLQHYPRTNCFGSNETVAYYTSHSNVVALAEWQKDGIEIAKAANKPVLLGEFNSASCGGIPGVSDTFAATLWTMDYVLQLASVGYSGAFIHTRERGITYNLFDPPASNDTTSNWTTLPAYYALLSTTEALSSGWQNGSLVVDLKLENSSESSNMAGYGIYDGQTSALSTLVFLNYADAGQDSAVFSIPPSGSDAIFVRTLTASNLLEKVNISWAGKTFRDVGDAIMVESNFAPDLQVSCNETCDFVVPSPGAVVVWFNQSNSDPGDSPSSNRGSSASKRPSVLLTFALAPLAFCVIAFVVNS